MKGEGKGTPFSPRNQCISDKNPVYLLTNDTGCTVVQQNCHTKLSDAVLKFSRILDGGGLFGQRLLVLPTSSLILISENSTIPDRVVVYNTNK